MKTTSNNKSKLVNSIVVLVSLIILSIQCKDVYLDLTSYQLGATYPLVVEVEAGENLIITLKENPTTGYRWMVIDQDLKARGIFDIVKLTNESYTSTPPPKGFMG
jgi:hypothetical protein